ncbi:hypothetical protein T08_10348 [Trichinella sp. T8]|nr:hypothetical protein T08_10348 [Trichinella sp. T8]
MYKQLNKLDIGKTMMYASWSYLFLSMMRCTLRFSHFSGDGPTGAQLYSHSGPLFIYWSLSSLFY